MKPLKNIVGLLILLSTANAAAGPLNFSTDRYVENRLVEVLLNPDETSGTLIVRQYDCSQCNPENFTFDLSLRVIYEGKDYPLGVLGTWRMFTADIVFRKDSGQLVAVKRVK